MKYEHEEVLNNFTAACEEVMNCKFIVAEIKIMKLLKCVAESLPIYNEIENALKDFNYEYEFQKCKIPNEDGGYELVLPVEATKKVALIFRILYDIDAKNIDLQKFINDYFVFDGEPYEAYKNFCNKIIRAFMENIVYLLTGIELIDEAPKVDYAPDLNLTDRCIVDIMAILKKINKFFTGDLLKEGQKGEGIIVCNGFVNALLTKKPETILITWIGLKNTLKDVKKILPYLKKIEEKLRASGIFSV